MKNLGLMFKKLIFSKFSKCVKNYVRTTFLVIIARTHELRLDI